MDAVQAFYNQIQGKTIAVVGVGVSNTPLIRLLVTHGAKVTACDKKSPQQLGEIYEELSGLGVTFHTGEGYLDHLDQEIIFKTPGLRRDVPQLLEAERRGAEITSEMEVFFQLCPCPIVAVSGSDGKTTTTSIIYEMLKQQGFTCHLGGNIGRPLLPEIESIRPQDMCVVELSSFQLHTMKQSPHVAVVTNVTPNHLDWHTDMAEYIAAKETLLAHQGKEDRAVCNADNPVTADFLRRAKGEALAFSSHGEVQKGYFLRGREIIRRMDGQDEPVMDIGEIRIVGMHNVENYMAAMAAVDGLVSRENMVEVARNFAGVEHRIEFVRELEGVRYYNDSIASSPTRTIAGLHAFQQKVILIAGGYDKKIPFDVLGPEIVDHVKTLVLTGATSEKIRAAVENAAGYQPGQPAILQCNGMEEAVAAARKCAQPGDVVTLSPACASFDAYPNFMERGWKFKELVRQLN
ncbi:MAG: UDP-N-acetylmuramoyl-L-alanine--D-glutamate ligase [Eubacteriales bacterium]|jgi:UDP-N-acetylmuramoylalanine--D-glutamate ligase